MRTIQLNTMNSTYPIEPIYFNAISDVSIFAFVECFCSVYKCDFEAIRGRNRIEENREPRQILMKLLRDNYSALSQKRVGRMFGDRDHATVLHSCKVVLNSFDTDKRYRANLLRVINEMEFKLKKIVHFLNPQQNEHNTTNSSNKLV